MALDRCDVRKGGQAQFGRHRGPTRAAQSTRGWCEPRATSLWDESLRETPVGSFAERRAIQDIVVTTIVKERSAARGGDARDARGMSANRFGRW